MYLLPCGASQVLSSALHADCMIFFHSPWFGELFKRLMMSKQATMFCKAVKIQAFSKTAGQSACYQTINSGISIC
jgi:hypothetical protein